MKIARFVHDSRTHTGLVIDDRITPIRGDIYGSYETLAESFAISEVQLIAPVQPGVVAGIGANYLGHLNEVGIQVPERPFVFLKPSSSVIGTDGVIRVSPDMGAIDCAGELAVVMGREAIQVKTGVALDYVLGYTCAIDVTAKGDGDMRNVAIAKGRFGFCPLGPWIDTNVDGGHTQLVSRLNGRIRQSTDTSEMLFGVAEIIGYLSSFMTLRPGTVIITGSSARGSSRIEPGDEIEVEVDGIGVLRSRVE